MSHRYAGQWIAGAHLYGDAGLGVLGSQVPAGGEHGAPPMYAQLLASDMTKEVRWLITSAPVGLTSFFAFEDGAYTASGVDGTYSFNWDFYVDGALRSSHTASFTIGDLLSASSNAQAVASGGLSVGANLAGDGGSGAGGSGDLGGVTTLIGDGGSQASGGGGLEVATPLAGDGGAGSVGGGDVAITNEVTLAGDGKSATNSEGAALVATTFSGASNVASISSARLAEEANLAGDGAGSGKGGGNVVISINSALLSAPRRVSVNKQTARRP